MKKIVLSALVCVSICACKKKDETPVPTAPTSSSTRHCTATVNGSAFSADSYGSFSTGLPYYNITCSNQTTGNPQIQLSGKFETGVHPVGVAPNYYSGMYRINNVTYTAVSGSFNITRNDTTTSGPYVEHYTATFEFNTDTIGGVSYQVTNGSIDYF